MNFGAYNDNTNLLQIMDTVKDKVMSDLNCHNVGRVIEFNKDKQTVTVELMQIKQFNDVDYLPTVIANIPLLVYGGGTGHVTLPDPVGTNVLLFFLDRNIDNFLETNEQYVPASTRMHSFTDCIALSTFKTLTNPLEDYDDLAISILNEIVIDSVLYKASNKTYGNYIQQKVTALDAEQNQATSLTTLTSTTYTIQTAQAGQMQIDNLIQLKNATYSLATLMNDFLTVCQSIAVDPTSHTLVASVVQSFEDLKTQFGGLLKP